MWFCGFERENIILTGNCDFTVFAGKHDFMVLMEKMQFLRKNIIFWFLAKTRFYDFGKTKWNCNFFLIS